ncbi:CatB-related O-acetyltransferase [Paracoccus seriniphilus]|uniref:Virginiamycin A acetyltransferase n=1 Tax=Paracoccus seriniphilus TaxID=184748 RepID=A0A239PY86_9RHOB|nr:CatB-related O-acetyltransferase [Paracoccus seriniphilus]SNT74922.1 virginiamycin A acetyltransferase [Paracoccus seriniphilus]
MLMKSIFSKKEIDQLFRLDDAKRVRSGNIRGPLSKWTISGNVSCGRYSSINGVFNARGQVRIGNYCAFGQFVSLLSGNHRTDMPNQQIWLSQRHGFKSPHESKGPIEIGHNVWIGDKVNVLSGVQVGHGSVIAAGATVTRSVGPFEIVAGTPARVLKKRFTDNVVGQLLEIQWWNWDEERISSNQKFFETEIPSDKDMDLLSLIV